MIEHCLKCYGDRLEDNDNPADETGSYGVTLLGVHFKIIMCTSNVCLPGRRVLWALGGQSVPVLCWTVVETSWEGELEVVTVS